MASHEAIINTRLAVNSLFMMYSTLLLVFVIIGTSMFYSGLTQRRSSFTMLGTPFLICAIVFLDWFIWGYSLCYSSSENGFIGNLDFAVLKHLSQSSEELYTTQRGDILAITHFLFNGLMKLVCVALTFPACAAERGRILPMMVFVLFWSTIVYDPVNYWLWNRNGWLSSQLNKLPVLDFAGGTCVHIVSGFTALAYSFYVGPRSKEIVQNYRSSNNGLAILGLVFILFGWSGFISGCDFNFSVTSIYLVVATFLCAFSAGLTWAAIDYYFSLVPVGANSMQNHSEELGIHDSAVVSNNPKRSLSLVSFSSGIMCGLVVFTPAGGYLCFSGNFWKSIVCGVIGGITGNLSTRFKYFLRVDDALDIFAVHGICGIVGSMLVGIFAETSYDSRGGWIEHNWKQLGYQILGVVITAIYVFVLSLFLLYLIDLIPGMHIRIDKDFNRRFRAESKGFNEKTDESVSNLKQSHEFQRLEFMGSDYSELDGEYMMDFVEFIKVLDPEDFNEEASSEMVIKSEQWSPGIAENTALRKREVAGPLR